MTYRVRVRSVALAELAEATEWYSARSRPAAERFVVTVSAFRASPTVHTSECAEQTAT